MNSEYESHRIKINMATEPKRCTEGGLMNELVGEAIYSDYRISSVEVHIDIHKLLIELNGK